MSLTPRQRALAMDDFTYEELLSSPEFETLRRLTEQEEFTPGDALREIHRLFVIDAAEVTDSRYCVPYNVAESLTEIASRTDAANQGQLVDFATRLYSETEHDPDTGIPLKYQDDKPLWTENDCFIFSANRAYRDELGPWDRSPAFIHSRKFSSHGNSFPQMLTTLQAHKMTKCCPYGNDVG